MNFVLLGAKFLGISFSWRKGRGGGVPDNGFRSDIALGLKPTSSPGCYRSPIVFREP